MMNIVSAIFDRNSDDVPAIIHGGGEISYRELHDHVCHISSALKSHVLWPRSGIPRVGLSFPSGPGYVALALGILKAGGCFLPVPDELTQPERNQLIAVTSADLLMTGESKLTAKFKVKK